ncbi:MAG TPA: arginine N-succinyltransferase [Myxococcales bacterium]|nr:arginine N-succinyltransferase [Myxococcales bacterium]HIM01110.1 arginine N-succinyltransferase [Myxococcales bacterium]
MMILRPVATEDLDDLLELAGGLDSMNLPRDPTFLSQRIALSKRSFGQQLASDECGVYLFVMEDAEAQRVVGTSMVMAKHGVPGHPYYWFEVSSEERRSDELDKRFVHTKLRLRSTEDGPTEIGGLILEPSYRRHPQMCGKALSIVRFAYMSMHPDRFQREITAEMLSPFKESGGNLLWDAFGRRFTGLEYREADHRSARNKQFIADLFPRDPVYATLFPESVQQTIGMPNETAKAAVRILEKVGFRYLNQVDPFDGGPYYGAARDAITSVRERRELVLPSACNEDSHDMMGPLALLSTETGRGFRATVVSIEECGTPVVTKRCREALGVAAGERVTVTPLP